MSAASSGQRAKRLLMGGAIASVLGVAIAGTVNQKVGGAIVVVGWLDLLYALHALGRSES
jgi:hypothetical protein